MYSLLICIISKRYHLQFALDHKHCTDLRRRLIYDIVRWVYSLAEDEVGYTLKGHDCVSAKDKKQMDEGM